PQLRLHDVRVEMAQASRELPLCFRWIGSGEIEVQIRHGWVLMRWGAGPRMDMHSSKRGTFGRLGFTLWEMGGLRPPPSEGNILDGRLVECDHEIIRRDRDRSDDVVVERLQQSQFLLLGTPRDKGNLQ